MNIFKNLTSIPLILIIVGFLIVSLTEIVGVSTIVSSTETVEINTIFEVKGKVIVGKKQSKKPQPATVGLTLSPDDQLTVPVNTSVKIYCSNQQIWEVKPGKYTVSSGCPSGKAVIRLPNSNNDTLRPLGKTEEALSKLPYLITPRETNILSNRPRLKWNAVPGAANYTVKIDSIDWETQTSKTEIVYPGEPLLQVGRRYRITIEADNGASSGSEGVVGFKVLDEQTQKVVLDAVNIIKQQQLSLEAQGLVLAHLYRGYGLYADAVEELEELVNKKSQVTTVYQLLGDTYLRIGLPQLAKKPYEKALELAMGTEDLSAQSAIQASLGKAYGSFGNESEAVQWLDKAKAGYKELGDSVQVQELDKDINSILGRE